MKFKYSDYYIKLGLNIQYYRKLSKFTQEQLADAIGIDRVHMGYIEQARAGVSLDVIFALAEALQVPAYKFFEFRD